MKSPYVFLLLSLLIGIPMIWADQYTVTNTTDDLPGSLRQAIIDANNHAGSDSIVFNIGLNDPNYDAKTGVWTIRLKSPLPPLEDVGTFINGISQSENQGDVNPDGLEIELDGTNANGDCFIISSGKNCIRGLVINRFSGNAIIIFGPPAELNTVYSNFIGTDADGKEALPNRTGIKIQDGAKSNTIGSRGKGNIISGNTDFGIVVSDEGTDNNVVKGNLIGTTIMGDEALGNGYGGVFIGYGPIGTQVGGVREGNLISGTQTKGNIYTGNGVTITESNASKIVGNYIGSDVMAGKVLGNAQIGICVYKGEDNIIGGPTDDERNLIVGSGWVGILIRSSSYTFVTNNAIGTDFEGISDFGNVSDGILLDFGANNNTIGPNNIIAYNWGDGVKVLHDSTIQNTITQNSITQNSGKGIRTEAGGNGELAPPVIQEVSPGLVQGEALPNGHLEIFSDLSDEGSFFEAAITVRNSGGFAYLRTVTGPNVTATVTDADGNTSEFSAPLTTTVDRDARDQVPVVFSLSQNFPNPFNPTTRILYGLPEGVRVELKILNSLGGEVSILVNGYQSAGVHAVYWDGRDMHGHPVSSGVYLYRIEAGEYKASKKLILMR